MSHKSSRLASNPPVWSASNRSWIYSAGTPSRPHRGPGPRGFSLLIHRSWRDDVPVPTRLQEHGVTVALMPWGSSPDLPREVWLQRVQDGPRDDLLAVLQASLTEHVVAVVQVVGEHPGSWVHPPDVLRIIGRRHDRGVSLLPNQPVPLAVVHRLVFQPSTLVYAPASVFVRHPVWEDDFPGRLLTHKTHDLPGGSSRPVLVGSAH